VDREIGTFSPDGRLLALLSPKDKSVRLYDVSGRRELAWRIEDEDVILTTDFSPDGRTLATGNHAGVVRLWEIATAKERLRLVGHRGFVNHVLFAPGGKRMVSVGYDSTAVVWDLDKPLRDDSWVASDRTTPSLDRLWSDLASDDATIAYRAIRAFAAIPTMTTPFLDQRLHAVPSPDSKRVERLLADLDDKSPAVREAASAQLSDMGESVAEALQRVLVGRPSVEVRAR
jgi:hypothetical protein